MARVAVVTGGTRGIGEAISCGLAKAGYKVAATYHGNDDRAREFSGRTGIQAFKFDVCDFAACQEGVKEIEAALGPIDVAGQQCRHHPRLHAAAHDFEQWNEVIQTNLTSCFNMCRLVIEGMRARSFGRIVNIGSINGQAGQYGQVNYAAAKSGIHGFTKALAQEGRALRHHRQRHRARLYRYRHGARRAGAGAGEDRRQDSRSAAWAMPRRSPAACSSWSPTRAASSPARRSPSTAASTCIEGEARHFSAGLLSIPQTEKENSHGAGEAHRIRGCEPRGARRL